MAIEEKRYCPNCGEEMDDEDFEYCESCHYDENQGIGDFSDDDLEPNELFDE